MTAPLFSIVIPTRNRAAFLRHALRSAVEQQFNDFEVVVLANDCEDDTRNVVSQLSNHRVRYFETPRTLTTPDTWEFAWTKATGRYVTFLPDDAALVPRALQTIAENALEGAPPVVIWEDAPYYYPDWHDTLTRNLLLLFHCGDQLVENIPSEVYRKHCARFEFAWNSPLPKLVNCIADREFFEGWRLKLGRLFFPMAPDCSFAWISTHVSPDIRVVHRPLSVRGVSEHGLCSIAGLGAASEEFVLEFGDFNFFPEAPRDIPTSLNHLAATFLRAGGALKAEGIAVEELDRAAFLSAAAVELDESRGGSPDRPLIESIATLKHRTARMALEDPSRLRTSAGAHLGDEACARCILGLEAGVLAESHWEYLYVIGDEIGVFDAHAMCRRVDRYYDLLARCRGKHDRAAADAVVADYDQDTDIQLLTALLKRLDNKIAIDVGAERGSFVRAFLDNGASSVIAVEPFPGNVVALQEQFVSSPAVRILDIALGDHDGVATLYIAEDKTGERSDAYHSLVRFDETPTIRRVREIDVQCRTLGSLMEEGVIPAEVGILKIDTERSDFAVIKGMGQLSASVVMLEFWDDLVETVGAGPYRLSEVADRMREHGYSTFAVIKRNDEFEIVQLNDTSTRPGDWGNAIFLHDDVAASLSDLISAAAADSHNRLIDRAKMFARECRNRLTVIDEQQRRIQFLEHLEDETSKQAMSHGSSTTEFNPSSDVEPGLELDESASEHKSGPANPELDPADGSPTLIDLMQRQSDVLDRIEAGLEEARLKVEMDSGPPALVDLMVRQSQVLDRIEGALEHRTVSYERAREDLERQFENRLADAERLRAEAEAAALARLAVIDEQQHALEHYRFWWWSERVRRSWSPKLGRLYQYPPRQLKIPGRYLRLPVLPEIAPTISIVTPSLNQGLFLERTLKSVLEQGYPQLEYIVQDAVSNDETPLILERYAARLAHVDSRPDAGFGNGINLGFSHATGEIMAYLNSDDVLIPGTLHYVAAYFAKHPEIDVVYGHRVVIDEYDAEIGRWVLPGHEDDVLSWADFVPQETLFWRRRIWQKAGSAIDESFRFAIDWDLLIRFRDAGARIQRLPRFLGAFRVHPHQKTSSSLQDLGNHEMNLLRMRTHGRTVTSAEINQALAKYLRKHIIIDKLYRFGVLRY